MVAVDLTAHACATLIRSSVFIYFTVMPRHRPLDNHQRHSFCTVVQEVLLQLGRAQTKSARDLTRLYSNFNILPPDLRSPGRSIIDNMYLAGTWEACLFQVYMELDPRTVNHASKAYRERRSASTQQYQLALLALDAVCCSAHAPLTRNEGTSHKRNASPTLDDALRAADAQRQRLCRASLTPSQGDAARATHTACERARRESLTPTQRDAMRTGNAERERARRASVTPTQGDAAKAAHAERERARRASLTPSQRGAMRAANAQRQCARRLLLAPTQGDADRQCTVTSEGDSAALLSQLAATLHAYIGLDPASAVVDAPTHIDGIAVASAFRQHMEEHKPTAVCAACSCFKPHCDVVGVLLATAVGKALLTPLRCDEESTPEHPRHGLTRCCISGVDYCIQHDGGAIVWRGEGASRHPHCAMLCTACFSTLQHNRVPNDSLVCVDRGPWPIVRGVPLPQLTLVEQALLAGLRVSRYMIVLRGVGSQTRATAACQRGLRGHVVAFPKAHPGRISSLLLPCPRRDIADSIKVVFMAGSRSHDELRAAASRAPALRVCGRHIIAWAPYLAACYRRHGLCDADVDDTVLRTYESVDGVLPELLDDALHASSDAEAESLANECWDIRRGYANQRQGDAADTGPSVPAPLHHTSAPPKLPTTTVPSIAPQSSHSSQDDAPPLNEPIGEMHGLDDMESVTPEGFHAQDAHSAAATSAAMRSLRDGGILAVGTGDMPWSDYRADWLPLVHVR